jgi:RNA ligase
MTALDTLIPPTDLATAIDTGLVTRKQHPTLRCRGLIADDKTGEIVAWPFPKFFNVGEHQHGNDYAPPLPDGELFEVYDKIDGSLGIVYWYAGRWRAASKGSFTSEQAQWAQQWIDSRDTRGLWPDTTYLAEIIYPGNRIVVDYGQREDLVLLAAFDYDGTEIPLRAAAADWLEIGTVVRSWPALPLAELLAYTESNSRPDGQQTGGMHAEGYVIRYASGLRAKAKLTEYVRLHKILTGITERDIWRYLGMQLFADQPPKLVAKALGCPPAEIVALAGAGQGPLDALLEQVPDEFDAWVRGVAARLERETAALDARVIDEFDTIEHLAYDRGAFARAAQSIEHQGVRAAMFLRLDGKDTGLHLWRAIKPEASAPFVADDET